MGTDDLMDDALAALVADFAHYKPLKGARIALPSSLSALTETLTTFGSENFLFPSIDRLQYAVEMDQVRYEWYRGGGPDLIVDPAGDIILTINEGVKAEEIYEKTGDLPDPSSTDDPKLRFVLTIVSQDLKTDPMRYRNIQRRLQGVSVETTPAVNRVYHMQANGTLSFPVINVRDSVTEGKFRKLYGCHYAFLDGVKRATNNMKISGKKALVCGYGDDDSEGCAIALKQAGADVAVYEVNPKPALQARLRGFSVIETLNDCIVSGADIFVTNINEANTNLSLLDHVKKMKNKALIYDTDPTWDSHNGDVHGTGLEQKFPCMKLIPLDPHMDKWVIPETNSSIIVLRNAGYPNFMVSWSWTCHVIALLELWSNRGTGKLENKVYDLPGHLQEKVSDLHLRSFLTPQKKKNGHSVGDGDGDGDGDDDDDMSFVPKKSDKRRILLMVVEVCSLFFGIIWVSSGLRNLAQISHFPTSP